MTIRINRTGSSGSSGGTGYRYSAMDSRGQEVEGTLSAATEADAIRQIKDRGLFPTRVGLDGPAPAPAPRPRVVDDGDRLSVGLPLLGLVSRREKAAMFSNLAAMVNAGIPLLRCLHVMARTEKNRTLRAVAHDMGLAVESGSTFAEAMAQFPKVFDHVHVNMVKAGEAAGCLHVSLDRLYDHIEVEGRIRSGVRWAVLSALGAGGCAVATVALAAMAFAPGVPVVQVAAMVLAVIAVLWAVSFAASKAFPAAFDRAKLFVPVFGRLSANRDVASFCRLFGILMTGGVPILQALNLSREACSNRTFSGLAQHIHDCVKEGDSIVGALEGSRVFPSVATSMIQVGEETGTLPEMLMRVADMHEKDVERDVRLLNTFSMAAAVSSVLAIAVILMAR